MHFSAAKPRSLRRSGWQQVQGQLEGALQRLSLAERRLEAAELEVLQLRRELWERSKGGSTGTSTNGAAAASSNGSGGSGGGST